MQYSKRRGLLIEGSVRGSVKSGHPTDTTFGNSVRSAVYASYLTDCEKLGTFLVAGDDMLIVAAKASVPRIETRIREFYDD